MSQITTGKAADGMGDRPNNLLGGERNGAISPLTNLW